MKTLGEYTLGDMRLTYLTDEDGHVTMRLIPEEAVGAVREKTHCAPESLVQLHIRGDALPGGFSNGATMSLSGSVRNLRLVSHERQDGRVLTVLADGGRVVRHTVAWDGDAEALVVSTAFENRTEQPLTLEYLSSFSLGGLTPFAADEAPGQLTIHRFRSAWSAEARLVSDTAEALNLSPSWSRFGTRVERFGQAGSMPVRGWFPFLAVEDTARGVVWAAQLAVPASWQMEVRRRDDGLSMTGGLPDFDFGHWAKTLAPGEGFEAPQAFLTVSRGDVNRAAQRLLSVQRSRWVGRDRPLPVLFNEYCTTWGNPSEENLAKIAAALRGKDIDYMVIDAGWYMGDDGNWGDCGGDWIPNETKLFPHGLKHTADMIRAAGLKPGLWFEAETCAAKSALRQREDMLLRRGGVPLSTGGRWFLDLRQEQVQDYLKERVIGLLASCGFEYVKIDYNDTIGVGCDGAESLGEGLRQNAEGSLRFFREMRKALPGLCVENCSSGGHRLSPAYMAVSDMASFSDAHECVEIPIIAASLQRLILPGQSQIWAVLRASDSLRRINYSLVNTFLGVMCLSGDILDLSPE
ncbi:MAG: alpha-galactosidase, partial [Clostridia bacterium]|nr:alpha-galactosidase [Clostridia bacterium]